MKLRSLVFVLIIADSFVAFSDSFRDSKNPASVGHPALPFPSDFFASEDPSSPTGIRLSVPENLMLETVVAELPENLRPKNVLNGKDGFSAASKIVFELNYDIDESTLRTANDPTVLVF